MPIGDVRYAAECMPEDAEWFEHSAMIHGDYCGAGVIGRSNIEVLQRDFADLEDKAWWLCHASHGTRYVRFDARIDRPDPWRSEEVKSLSEMLSNLNDYIVADEEHESTCEQEDYEEAWNNFGASDMCHALADAYPHHGSDFYAAIPAGALMLAWEALNPSGEYCIHEQGGVCFSFDRVFGAYAGVCKPSYAEVRTALREAIATVRECEAAT